jgi:hypothetical protein
VTTPIRSLPELGPLLGRMASPASRGPAELPLDDIRFELLSALYIRAGLARGEFAAGRPDVARHQLGREAWLAVWRDASGRVAARLLEALDGRFAAAAAESRMPARLLERMGLPREDRDVIRNRIEACGIGLEEMAPPEDTGPWPDGLLRSAMALDDAWERLEAVVVQELARYGPAVEVVRQWRRPLAPLWAGTVLAVATVLGLGLSLGGYLPAPGLLGSLQRWFWSLPWP